MDRETHDFYRRCARDLAARETFWLEGLDAGGPAVEALPTFLPVFVCS